MVGKLSQLMHRKCHIEGAWPETVIYEPITDLASFLLVTQVKVFQEALDTHIYKLLIYLITDRKFVYYIC